MSDPGGPTLFDMALAQDAQPTGVDAPRTTLNTARRAAAVPPVEEVPTGPVLLAVDGNSLLHRAFHAYGPPATTPGSRDGLYGFLSLFAGVMELAKASAVVVGFDCGQQSVRRGVWAGYKAQRPPKDPGLYALLDIAQMALADLGVYTVVPEGWEADDVLGSAAATAEQHDWRAVLATSDRDALGLVSDTTSVLQLRSGLSNAVTVDQRRLRRDVGVRAEQYVEFAALRGDTSDNLKGVQGIGPSRAKALLAMYDTVTEAVADPIGCRSVLGRDPGQELIDDFTAKESVFHRNVELMTIRRDLEVDLNASRPALRTADLVKACDAWNVGALVGRLGPGLTTSDSWVPPSDADAPPT